MSQQGKTSGHSRAFALLPISAPGLPFPDARAVETTTDDMPIESGAQVANLMNVIAAPSVLSNPIALHVLVQSHWQSETAYFAFRLSASKAGEGVARNHARAEHGADLPARLVQ